MKGTLLIAVLGLSLNSALAATPVALVQSISDGVAGQSPFDFLESGDLIRLNPDQEIEIGYFSSCVTERISGGTIRVGEEQSEVSDAVSVQRLTSECEGPTLALSADEYQLSGAVAVRPLRTDIAPELEITHSNPAFLLDNTRSATLKRLDQREDKLRFSFSETERVMLDLDKEGVTLTPGGTYMITAGARSMVFAISPLAVVSRAGTLPRLLIPRETIKFTGTP